MTDNEKRAHDLAIALIPLMQKSHNAQVLNGELAEDDVFDAYEYYMGCYKSALESFNRDFPDGK
ncbi:MAG TPA: hypothetical protein H9695_11780 [Candidatus Mediterraneibacter excrementigallinarum]|nr:hypothetical protein [Candidatus Mediterraneibacter excrementigallinarum]